MTNGNCGNVNGHQKIVADGCLGRDTTAVCYVVDQGGNPLPFSRRDLTELGEDGTARYRYVWESVPADAVAIRVVIFNEGRGYWSPIALPEAQSDAMISSVETLLNDHGLSIVAGLGISRKWDKGARHRCG
jgi:hypothetical protein